MKFIDDVLLGFFFFKASFFSALHSQPIVNKTKRKWVGLKNHGAVITNKDQNGECGWSQWANVLLNAPTTLLWGVGKSQECHTSHQEWGQPWPGGLVG